MIMRFSSSILIGFLTVSSLSFAYQPTLQDPPATEASFVTDKGGQEALTEPSTTVASGWRILKNAEERLRGNQYREVLSMLENQPLDEGWNVYKNVLLAKAYFNQNAALKTVQLLEDLSSEPQPGLARNQEFYRQLFYDALELKSRALKQLGRSDSQVAERLWALFPDKAVVSPLSPSLDARMTRARWSYALGLNDKLQGLISTSSIVNSGSPLACQVLIDLAQGLRGGKMWVEALDAYTAGARLDCDEDTTSKFIYWKAKLQSRAKNYAAAIDAYREFIEKFPNHRLTDDAYFALIDLYADSGNTSKSNKARDLLMNLGKGDMRAKLLWEKAEDLYKKRHLDRAISVLDTLLKSEPGDDESYPQALYWKARWMEKKGGKKSKSEITSLHQRLVSEFPYSFYALLSAKALGKTHKPPVPSVPSVSVPSDAFSQEIFSTLKEFAAANQKKEAQSLFDYYLAVSTKARSNKVLMAKTWMESGDYNQTLKMAMEYYAMGPSEGVRVKKDDMAFALFPRAYKEEVRKISRSVALPKAAILGIIREESHFDDDIVSVAGAKGLMQLMPATAQMQAKSMAIDYQGVYDLEQPDINIALGSGYLKRMIGNYDGFIPYAIMAYNAGPGNVNKWKKTNGHLPFDEFVEAIPFSETRGYIKRVMRSMNVYAAINGETVSFF